MDLTPDIFRSEEFFENSRYESAKKFQFMKKVCYTRIKGSENRRRTAGEVWTLGADSGSAKEEN